MKTAPRWSASVSHVRRALKFVRAKGIVTPEQLVEWDNIHGRRLFTWDDEEAAEAWRLHEARLFLGSFRMRTDGLRVRAFINLPADEDAGVPERAYYTAELISADPSLRELVLADLGRRIANLGREARMWRLTDAERWEVIAKLAAALGREDEAGRHSSSRAGVPAGVKNAVDAPGRARGRLQPVQTHGRETRLPEDRVTGRP